VFDYYSATDFKFVSVDLSIGAIAIGHFKRGTWVTDARFSRVLTPGADVKLTLQLNATTGVTVLHERRRGSAPSPTNGARPPPDAGLRDLQP
jgi:hypothetical protein